MLCRRLASAHFQSTRLLSSPLLSSSSSSSLSRLFFPRRFFHNQLSLPWRQIRPFSSDNSIPGGPLNVNKGDDKPEGEWEVQEETLKDTTMSKFTLPAMETSKDDKGIPLSEMPASHFAKDRVKLQKLIRATEHLRQTEGQGEPGNDALKSENLMCKHLLEFPDLWTLGVVSKEGRITVNGIPVERGVFEGELDESPQNPAPPGPDNIGPDVLWALCIFTDKARAYSFMREFSDLGILNIEEQGQFLSLSEKSIEPLEFFSQALQDDKRFGIVLLDPSTTEICLNRSDLLLWTECLMFDRALRSVAKTEGSDNSNLIRLVQAHPKFLSVQINGTCLRLRFKDKSWFVLFTSPEKADRFFDRQEGCPFISGTDSLREGLQSFNDANLTFLDGREIMGNNKHTKGTDGVIINPHCKQQDLCITIENPVPHDEESKASEPLEILFIDPEEIKRLEEQRNRAPTTKKPKKKKGK